MRRVVRDVEEERLARRRARVLLHPGDGLVGPVVGGVVAVAVDLVVEERVVLDQLGRREVMRLAAQEAVEAVEAARERPRRAVRRRRDVVLGRVVPLADHVGRPAARTQDFRERGRVARHLARAVAGVARVVERQPAAPDGVRILSRQQRGAGGRAHGHRRVVPETHAARGHAVDGRRADLGAEAAEVGEAQVVEEDHDDVGRTRRRTGTRRPVWRRVAQRAADAAVPVAPRVVRLQVVAFGVVRHAVNPPRCWRSSPPISSARRRPS